MITAFLRKLISPFVNLWRTVVSMVRKRAKVIVRDVTHDGESDILITSDDQFTSNFLGPADHINQIENNNKEE